MELRDGISWEERLEYQGKRSTANKRVLVIDDNPAMRAVIKEALGLRFHVSVAADGREGLKKFNSSRFDLIITDAEMPFIDGYQLARQVKGRSPNLPVVMISSWDPSEAKDFLAQGILDHYFQKPFSLWDLSDLAEKILS